ncbi:MAG: oligosaccharide flippase family protein [Kouleothrix sp.]|jgi:O-antigen/teichoic acid export membrane protein|nr:oligosaccharide flippase family protein [Kouleothrix sp.]
MRTTAFHLPGANRAIVRNAGALIGTTAVNSGLGMLYWWLAARAFQLSAVGLASAAIAAMVLLGTIGTLGFGTLLISEVARQPRQAGRLISAAVLVAGTAAALAGLVFALAAPWLSHELRPLAEHRLNPLLFGLGAGFTAATLVLDQALVGLLWSDLQFWRNGLFALAKLGFLYATSIWLTGAGGMAIYTTWLAANVLSIGLAAALADRRGVRLLQPPDWSLLRRLGGAALWHNAFNLALLAPGLLLPLLVTALLSAEANASFYLAWMLAGLVFVVPTALTTVLHAIGAANRSALARATRQTLVLSLPATLLAGGLLFGGAAWALGLFGASYAAQATWCLRLLCLGGVPAIVKTHYIAIRRARDELPSAFPALLAGGLLELALATIGVLLGGLIGLGCGWAAAVAIQAAYMGREVYQTASYTGPAPHEGRA